MGEGQGEGVHYILYILTDVIHQPLVEYLRLRPTESISACEPQGEGQAVVHRRKYFAEFFEANVERVFHLSPLYLAFPHEGGKN